MLTNHAKAAAAFSSHLIRHARIEQGVNEINDNVNNGVDNADNKRNRKGRLIVVDQDRIGDVGSDTWPVENRLDHYGACYDRPEEQTDLINRGDKRIAQHENTDEPPLRYAHCSFIQDEIFLQGLENSTSGKANDGGQCAESQCRSRHEDVLDSVREGTQIAGQQRVYQVRTGK